jgi:hypothetical protein
MYTDDPERTRVQRNPEMRLDSSGSFPESLRTAAMRAASDDDGVYRFPIRLRLNIGANLTIANYMSTWIGFACVTRRTGSGKLGGVSGARMTRWRQKT